MDWDDLRVFLAAAEAGSLGKTAKKLRLSQATVWRRLQGLEAALGTPLFERRRSGYVLAPAGVALLGELGHLPAAIEDARATLAKQRSTVEAELRIGMPEFLAVPLAASLSALAERHPRLAVEIISGSPFAGVEVRDADIVVSYQEPIATGYRLGATAAAPFGLYASARYLQKYGRPKSSRALDGHRLVAFDHGFAHVAPARWQKGQPWGASVVARCSSPHARIAAVAAGLGLGMLPLALARRSRELRELFGPDEIGSLDLRIYRRGDSPKRIYIEAVVDLIREVIAAGAG
jgi:DNA-binding transcriptional LysR family regulator